MKHSINNKEELISFVDYFILTPSEVMELLDINRQRLSTLIKNGRLKPIKKEGGTAVYYRNDVDTLKKELELGREKYRPYDQ
ncbi:helix-turn-helix domain-containing protein [Geomicrobium sp. JCM 19055]|uniref:helix-turn-helix domain-containing protein n=1 Tax=Geomicrobium sp. JCM 19055 TaxID=1460649 RepID=UPI00045EDCAA|nr:helix-turn-helix domain-containing protein [Geomicrobium sp. JCM 19055]GAK01527.1 hypothetical protein JCM19055_4701 [Geomicrobium sp. JCM 19055]